MSSTPPPDIDPLAVARSFGAASRSYDAAAWLQTAVRNELLSRLDLLRATPRAVLDLGAGTGVAAIEIKRRFRRAAVTAADIAAPMLQVARQRSRFWRPIRCVEADARALPFEDASFDLVFSSLMLQWLQPPDAALQEIRRVLRPGGLLLASSFGPATLQELRGAWAAADGGVHVNGFVDMHDLGSAFGRMGFVEPVLDVDRHLRHYPDARALMRELKALGAHNLDSRRARGLTGRGAFARMHAAYELQRQAAGLPATWQVVYAVAWAAAAPPRGEHLAHAMGAAGEVRIDADSLRGSRGAPVMSGDPVLPHPQLRQSLFVAGTDTGIGKTWVCVQLLRALTAAGHAAVGMKPLAAGVIATSEGPRNDDALALLAAGNVPLPYQLVNPVCLQGATSPHLAAADAGITVDIGSIVQAYDLIKSRCELVVVEGAGGWLAPIGPALPGTSGRTMQDIALALQLPVLLVVGIRLGALSHALLTAEAIRRSGLRLAGWAANCLEPGFADAERYVESLALRLPEPLLWRS